MLAQVKNASEQIQNQYKMWEQTINSLGQYLGMLERVLNLANMGLSPL